ncbi:MAG: thiamine phosphate synthase [Pseudomonadota bacterium]
MAPDGEPQGLYLIVEVADAAGAVARLRAALDAAPVRAVLLAPACGAVLSADSVRAALELAQKDGIAALIEDDDALARALGADGVHLTWSSDIEQRFRQARETVGGRAIVGVEAGSSRHDAMTLGEAGADYVAFSIAAGDTEAARADRLDLCAWWSEIFEVPCVAFDCADAEDARDLAEAGVDFLAVRLAAGASPAEVAERVEMVARALARREGVS